MFKSATSKKNKGVIITLVLVFGFIFLILLGGLLGFILLQYRQSVRRVAWSEALEVAESGIDYYRWCLNNGIEANCQTQKDYYDPEGVLVGEFSLDIIPTTSCGETITKKIISTGQTNDFPDIKRKVSVLYARISVGKYAYLLNDNVWAGSDREIRGLYHSNGGIRMDGENQSLVTSSQEEWVCTSSFGCSSCPTGDGCRVEDSDCICPGVFTTTFNSDPGLFDFPMPPFDFTGITVDLAQIRNHAKASSVYLPPSTDIDVQGKGYHIIFKNDGTFEVWIITWLSPTQAYSLEEGWHWDYFTIADEYLYNTFSLDSSCPVIFVEDNLWLEGEVKGKTTVASADLINPTKETDVILSGNINYTVKDGSDGLALIGENNILITPDSPNQMEIRGIFIAQKGRFGRNHYPGNIKDKLEINGSIVSNGTVGTQWTSGSSIISGYRERENYIDANLIYNPPPFVPYVEHDFKIVKWEEVE